MGSTNRRHRDFFDEVSAGYDNFIRARGSKEELSKRIEPRMGLKVLDIGNGGIREFVSPLTKQYIGLDFSLSMLKKGDKGFERVCGDALALPFKEEIFDTLFYRSMLHHLAGKRPGETEARVKEALINGRHLLKESGNVIVVEPCIPKGLERLERMGYFLIKLFCRVIRQPEVFLFSAFHLGEILRESGYKKISIQEIRSGKERPGRWVSPVIGLPWLKAPSGLLPVAQVVLEAYKGC